MVSPVPHDEGKPAKVEVLMNWKSGVFFCGIQTFAGIFGQMECGLALCLYWQLARC